MHCMFLTGDQDQDQGKIVVLHREKYSVIASISDLRVSQSQLKSHFHYLLSVEF